MFALPWLVGHFFINFFKFCNKKPGFTDQWYRITAPISMNIAIVLSLLFTYFIFNLYVAGKIAQAHYLSEERRQLHQKLIWFIPFFGPWMLKGFWTSSKQKRFDVITKENRKREQGGFYESGKGMWPELCEWWSIAVQRQTSIRNTEQRGVILELGSFCQCLNPKAVFVETAGGYV